MIKVSTSLKTSVLYDKIAEQILMPEDFYLNIARAIGCFSNSAKLLDIGCGNGCLLEKITELNPKSVLFGVDFSKKLIENARRRLGKRVKLLKADALALPFSDKMFDIVVMSEVIEHLKNPPQGLVEAKRVLKKHGRFILTFPNASSYQPFYPWIKKQTLGKLRFIFTPYEDLEKTGQPIDKCFSYNEIVLLLKQQKFKIKRISGTIFFPYLGEVPILSSIIIFLWRKTPFDWILSRLIGPQRAYRVLVEAIK